MVVTTVSLFLAWWILLFWWFNVQKVFAANTLSIWWVSNKVEYLSWMQVFPNTSSYGASNVSIGYHNEWLYITWAVNAKWLVVWDWVWLVPTSTVLWWENNELVKWNYSVIVWWKENKTEGVDAMLDNVIIWWEKNKLEGTISNVWILWAKEFDNTLNKENVAVIWWSQQNSVWWSNVVVQWSNLRSNKDENILLWDSINANAKDVTKVFVWNDWWDFEPNLDGWLYVAWSNGVGLNTEEPWVALDAWNASWMLVKTLTWTSIWQIDSKIKCDTAHPDNAWIVAFIEINWGGNKWTATCWCNWERWVPLDKDPLIQMFCKSQEKNDTLYGCLNNPANRDNSKLIMWLKRWSEQEQTWKFLEYTYGWVPSIEYPENVDKNECWYTCLTGYHPGVDYPSWWFTGDCIECWKLRDWTIERIEHMTVYDSPGTWNNNCDFRCEAWYLYNPEKRTCDPAPVGSYTTWDNKSLTWTACKIPVKLWLEWEEEPTTPYFLKFTSAWTWEYGCEFDCAPWFKYVFARTGTSITDWIVKPWVNNYPSKMWNSCFACRKWYYTTWWKVTTCSRCNIPENAIATSYWVSADTCNWRCDETKWFVKNEAWNGCVCPEWTKNEWGKCVSIHWMATCWW
jgi:hypothetical protein